MSAQPPTSDQTNRIIAALAYPVWLIIALVIVLTDLRKDPFVRHHGWTALFWSLAWAVIYTILMVLGHVPLLGWIFIVVIGPLLYVIWLALSIYYAVQAFGGKEVNIPIVSDLAKKYAV